MDKKKIIIIVITILVILALGFTIVNSLNKDNSKNNSTTTSEKKEKDKKKESKIVNLNETVENENIKITLESVNFKDKIEWSTGTYSSRSAYIEDGKTAISLSGSIKNMQGNAINTDAIVGKIIVDDKYNYDLKFSAHNSGYQIEPLENVEYDFYAQIPPEIQNTYTKIEFKFGFKDDFSIPSVTYVNGKKVEKLDSVDELYSLTVNK